MRFTHTKAACKHLQAAFYMLSVSHTSIISMGVPIRWFLRGLGQ